MRKNIAKSLVVGSLMLAIGFASFGPVASANTETKTKVQKVKKVKAIKAHKRTLPGRVVSVTGTTIVMTKGSKTYTIDATGVTPVDKKGAAVTFADIKAGDKISVRGMVAGTNVSGVLKLRDLNLPL